MAVMSKLCMKYRILYWKKGKKIVDTKFDRKVRNKKYRVMLKMKNNSKT